MHSAAFRRAKRLMQSRPGTLLAANLLGVLNSLLWLALLVTAGLMLGLAETRGITVLRPEALSPDGIAALPRPIADRLAGADTLGVSEIVVPDTGLYPLVVAGRESRNPILRAGARVLNFSVHRFRPLTRNRGALSALVMKALILLLILTTVSHLRRPLAAAASGQAAASMRHQIHRQMYRLGRSSLPSEGAGPIVNLFTHEVNEVRDGLVDELDHAWRVPTLAVGLLIVALAISPVLTIFLVTLGALIALATLPLVRGAKAEGEAAGGAAAEQLRLLLEDLAMLRTVRVYGMEAVDKDRFDAHLASFQRAEERRIRTEGRWSPTALLLAGSGAFLAAGMLGWYILNGWLSLAAAGVLLVAIAGLARPLTEWLAWRRTTAQAGVAAEAIFGYFDRRPELLQPVGARFLPPLRERLRFDNVTLTGPEGRPLLDGVSFDVPARTRTAIMGFDEEAKLALACMIPRLLDPQSGRVLLDAIDLREVTLESLRAQVATVLQADLLITDTVLANIGLGDSSFGLPRIIEAAKAAHAHHFLRDLPGGYETVVGPMGHPLAPDEAYRIALARAFLHDPSIVIIEEPTVPMDDGVKALVDDTIDRLAQGRTLIFLPHRLSTIRKCNQVIVLHNGKVESIGSPRDLNGQSKLYRHLQYVEFNQFATGEIEAGQMS